MWCRGIASDVQFFSIWYLSTWSFFFQRIQLERVCPFLQLIYILCLVEVLWPFSIYFNKRLPALFEGYLPLLFHWFFSNVFSTLQLDRRSVSVSTWTRPRNQVIQGKETEFYVCLKKVTHCFQKAKEDIHQHSLSTASKINHESKG